MASDQALLNKKNIQALAVAEKERRSQVEKLQRDVLKLTSLVTELSQQVQALRSELNIQKAVGGAIGSTAR